MKYFKLSITLVVVLLLALSGFFIFLACDLASAVTSGSDGVVWKQAK